MPSLFEQLSREAAGRGVRFLVIGGHAVIEHGFQRGTEDADILVSKEERAVWLEIVTGMGYALFRDAGTFLQFDPTDPTQWELDLMLVPADSFARLIDAAKSVKLEGAPVEVPSLEHLIALKVHAMKNSRGLRILKDMTDVAQLLSLNRIEADSTWVRAVFDKYGDKDLYERIVKLLS